MTADLEPKEKLIDIRRIIPRSRRQAIYLAVIIACLSIMFMYNESENFNNPRITFRDGLNNIDVDAYHEKRYEWLDRKNAFFWISTYYTGDRKSNNEELRAVINKYRSETAFTVKVEYPRHSPVIVEVPFEKLFVEFYESDRELFRNYGFKRGTANERFNLCPFVPAGWQERTIIPNKPLLEELLPHYKLRMMIMSGAVINEFISNVSLVCHLFSNLVIPANWVLISVCIVMLLKLITYREKR